VKVWAFGTVPKAQDCWVFCRKPKSPGQFQALELTQSWDFETVPKTQSQTTIWIFSSSQSQTPKSPQKPGTVIEAVSL